MREHIIIKTVDLDGREDIIDISHLDSWYEVIHFARGVRDTNQYKVVDVYEYDFSNQRTDLIASF